jgi:DNA-binding transcriptional MerR regulator
MENELISKKELLEAASITYGQLYRWKRKNLIPEEWFIRKSTFTGQETFSPKDKMVERIEQIQSLKEELSLDELAEMLSSRSSEKLIAKEDIIKKRIVPRNILAHYLEYIGDQSEYDFAQVLYLYILGKLLETGEISLEEGIELIQVLQEHYAKGKGQECELWIVRKMGVSLFLLTVGAGEAYWDARVRVMTKVSIASCIQELKLLLV